LPARSYLILYTLYLNSALHSREYSKDSSTVQDFARSHFCLSTGEPTGIVRAEAASGPAPTSSKTGDLPNLAEPPLSSNFSTACRLLARSFARRPAWQLVVWLAVCDLAVNFTFFLGSPSDGSALCYGQGFLQKFFQVRGRRAVMNVHTRNKTVFPVRAE